MSFGAPFCAHNPNPANGGSRGIPEQRPFRPPSPTCSDWGSWRSRMFKSIKPRIILLAGLPLCVALIFMANAIAVKYAVVREMDNLLVLSRLAVRISSLVHEIQKERGATGIFLGSGGNDYKSELEEERNHTDRQREALKAFAETATLTPFGKGFGSSLRGALAHLSRIDEHRSRIDALSIPARKSILFYTELNAALLSLVHRMGKVGSNLQIGRIGTAYANFLQIKERAGLERALLSKIFASGRFEQGDFIRLNTLVSDQNTFLNLFHTLAAPEYFAFYKRKLSDPAVSEVRRMRDIALARGADSTGEFDVAPEPWFDAATRKINLMKEVEDMIAADLSRHVFDLKERSRKTLFVISVSALAVMIAILWAGAMIVRSITRPINEIVEIAEAIARGDLSRRIEPRRGGEFGLLVTAFRNMQRQLTGLSKEIIELTEKSGNGELDHRGRADAFEGGWHELVHGINSLIDTFAFPIKLSADYVEKIAVGDIPDKIEGAYKGDFNRIKGNLNTLVDAMHELTSVADAVASGNYDRSIEPRGEKDRLVTAINRMTRSLGRMTEESRRENWLKTGQNALNEKMRGEQEPVPLTRGILAMLAEYLDLQVGACFLSGDGGTLRRVSGYALSGRPADDRSYAPGEGLVGQAALERRIILQGGKAAAEDTLTVDFGIGKRLPHHILFLPLIHEDRVKGVLVLGTTLEFTPLKLTLLERVSETMAVAVHVAESRIRMKHLLEKTRRQAGELSAGQEALRATNRELENQARILKESEERLKEQKEELRVSNEELEAARIELGKTVDERTEDLEAANRKLRKEIMERKNSQKEREKLIGELEEALGNIKTLKGLIPICSSCKKIRDDTGFWNQIEAYIETRSEALFSHGICPECSEKLYGDQEWYKKSKKNGKEGTT